MPRTAIRGGRARQAQAKTSQQIVDDLTRRGVPFFDVDHRERPVVSNMRMRGAVRKAAGTMYVNDIPVADSVECCHCGAHFFLQKDAAKASGWCMNCSGPHCPNQACHDCVPFKRRMEDAERRRV